MNLPGLIQCEQQINDRFGTDPAPALPAAMLPEAGQWYPMSWVVGEPGEVDVLADVPSDAGRWQSVFRRADGASLFPVHPLTAAKYDSSRIVCSGTFAVSASYRTVFFEPEADHPVADLIPADQLMMIKLHLDDPLPGNRGDRRLTPEKVHKCIDLSRHLPGQLQSLNGRHRMEIVRERAGLLLGNRGAIIRIVPRRQCLPLFSVYSRDATNPGEHPVLIRAFERLGFSSDEVAERFGELLGEPLLRGLLAGFSLGFSLEMHAQNTLVSLSERTLIDTVYFRDLESVLFFPEVRSVRGFAPCGLNLDNQELFPEPKLPARWFNRNVDHDLGRVFRGVLHALQKEEFFTSLHVKVATESCRRMYRALVQEFALGSLNGLGRWLPVSRTPYGSGWRPGDYYRSSFR